MRFALACSMLLLAACEQVVMANQRAGKLPVPIGGPHENGRLRGMYVQSWECR